MKFKKNLQLEIGMLLPLGRGTHGTEKGHKGTFGDDGNVLYLGLDGVAQVYTYIKLQQAVQN